MVKLIKLSPVGESHIFLDKIILLDKEVRVGRATNDSPSNVENLFFNSSVLSRNHAVMWSAGEDIFIKDTNSSNGTFLNGAILKPGKGNESAKFKLLEKDIIQFGTDVYQEDTKTYHLAVVAQITFLNILTFSYPLGDIEKNEKPSNISDHNITVDKSENFSSFMEEQLINESTVSRTKIINMSEIKKIINQFSVYQISIEKNIKEMAEKINELKYELKEKNEFIFEIFNVILRNKSLEKQIIVYSRDVNLSEIEHHIIKELKRLHKIEKHYKLEQYIDNDEICLNKTERDILGEEIFFFKLDKLADMLSTYKSKKDSSKELTFHNISMSDINFKSAAESLNDVINNLDYIFNSHIENDQNNTLQISESNTLLNIQDAEFLNVEKKEQIQIKRKKRKYNVKQWFLVGWFLGLTAGYFMFLFYK